MKKVKKTNHKAKRKMKPLTAHLVRRNTRTYVISDNRIICSF